MEEEQRIDMDAEKNILKVLEEKVEEMVERIRKLEADNLELRSQLEKEEKNKQAVLKRLDRLLQKIQEADNI